MPSARIEGAAAGGEFEVVGAQHDDHEIERLVRLSMIGRATAPLRLARIDIGSS